MTDREKVISEFEKICGYTLRPHEFQVLNDVLALLKEQEPIKPIFVENPYTHLPVSYCPQCREPIDEYIVGNPYKMTKFCHYCGKAVKWE